MKKIPSLLNIVIKYFQRHEIVGKYRFFELTKKKFNRSSITYHIAGADFSIPWDQWCFWKNYGPENYYLDEIIPFIDVLNNELKQFDFFDLGADVGVVSMLVNKHCKGLNRIIALEPNPITFGVLEQNLKNISQQHQAINQAISNFNGKAFFNFNRTQGSDHEGHIVINDNDNELNTKVTSLDRLIESSTQVTHKNIAIKIDVEGQEKAMLTGGVNTIANADKVVLLLELHPSVLERDGQTPEEIFAEAEKIRDFKWLVPLKNNQEVDRSISFYQQFPLQQYDVIGMVL